MSLDTPLNRQLTSENSAIEAGLIVSHVSGPCVRMCSKYLLDLGIKRQTDCKYAHVANILEYATPLAR